MPDILPALRYLPFETLSEEESVAVSQAHKVCLVRRTTGTSLNPRYTQDEEGDTKIMG